MPSGVTQHLQGDRKRNPQVSVLDQVARGMSAKLRRDLVAPDGSINLGFIQAEADAERRFVLDKLREELSLLDFIPHAQHASIYAGTNDNDMSTYFQNALDAALASKKILKLPAGRIVVSQPLTFLQTETDGDLCHGPVLIGAGMGRTTIDASAFADEDAAVLTVGVDDSELGNVFAKGCTLTGFTLYGNPNIAHNGIKLQACWFNLIENLRVNYCGQLTSTDALSTACGVVLGAYSATPNPDFSACYSTTFIGCDFDKNGIGVNNPENNCAPAQRYMGCSIRHNARGGIRGNSSLIFVDTGTSITYNGIEDAANAFGGVFIGQDADATANSYRPKGLHFSCEFDTNYPRNLVIRRGEGIRICENSCNFGDNVYDTGEWAARGITTFPEAQIEIGGTDAADQVFALVVDRTLRPSVQNTGQLATHANKHSIFWVRPYAIRSKVDDCRYNLDVGSWVAGTDYFLIREDAKTGTGFTDFKHHTIYDVPAVLSAVNYQAAFSMQFERVVSPRDRANLDFVFLMTDDTAISIKVPTLLSEWGGHYGCAFVCAQGLEANSAIFGYRASSGPACFKMSGNTGANMNFTTGALAGTTSTDAKLTISAHTDNRIYIENRLGSTVNVMLSFFALPGAIGQNW